MPIVPIVISEPPAEFGELKDSPEFYDKMGMNQDLTYVPKFSELRYARDKAISEMMQGRRRPSEVPTMPFNFRWVRCQNKKGEPDTRKAVLAGNRGYVAVTKDQIGEGKLLPELPAGAAINANGYVQQGDTILTWTTAERAARNERMKRARTEAAVKGVEQGFGPALEAAGGAPAVGAQPYIQKDVGRPIRAELNPKPAKG